MQAWIRGSYKIQQARFQLLTYQIQKQVRNNSMTRLEFRKKQKSKQPSFNFLNNIVSDSCEQQLYLAAENAKKTKEREVALKIKQIQKPLNSRRNCSDGWVKQTLKRNNLQKEALTPKKTTKQTKSLISKLSTREGTIIRPQTSFEKSRNNFLTSESEQYQRVVENFNQSEILCRDLAYMNGYLKAEVEQKQREIWSLKQKHFKEMQYLNDVAQKYREKAKKYKGALLQKNFDYPNPFKLHETKKKSTKSFSLSKQYY